MTVTVDQGRHTAGSRAAERVRVPALDGFRGLAILLMMLDHLALVFAVDPVQTSVRHTVGRLAFPAFFLLAGHLSSRPRWRWAGVALLGVVLPLAVPWIDSPNVLVLWALGCTVLWAGARAGVPAWTWILAALALSANRWEVGPVGSYDAAATLGLLALGTYVSRSWFVTVGELAPGWLVAVGRRPILWYVGHVLIVDGVYLWLSRG